MSAETACATMPATLMLVDQDGNDLPRPTSLAVMADRGPAGRLVTLQVDDTAFVVGADAFDSLLWMRLGRDLPEHLPLEATSDISVTDLDRVTAYHGGEVAYRVAANGEVFIPVVARLVRHRGSGPCDLRLGYLHVQVQADDLERAAQVVRA